jgi:uncharacterized protein
MNIQKKSKRQFIAGAVCPKCSDNDSIVLYPEENMIECVSCDFKESSEQRDAPSNSEGIKKTKSLLPNQYSIDVIKID